MTERPIFNPNSIPEQRRILDETRPVMSNLEDFWGKPILPKIQAIIDFYQDPHIRINQDLAYYDVPTFILVGIPGSGKSTIYQELQQTLVGNQYKLITVSYEETLERLHKDKNQNITPQIWRMVNDSLLDELTNDEQLFMQPTARLGELPGISRYMPQEIKKRRKITENRDRGTTALQKISWRMNKFPIYVIAVTGDNSARTEAVQEREQLLNMPQEQLVRYLLTKGLSDFGKKLTDDLVHRFTTMAMPHHLLAITDEFRDRSEKYSEHLDEEWVQRLFEYRKMIVNEELTPQKMTKLMEIIMFNYYLIDLGLHPDRIISVYNPFKPELRDTFIQRFSSDK